MMAESENRRASVRLISLLGWLTAASSLATDIYLPALPTLRHELNASAADAQYSLGLFFIGLALGQLIYGPLSDRYGRKPLLFFGFSLYLLASLLMTQAESVTAVVLMRGLQGVGAAAGQVIPRAIVRDNYGGAKAASVISFVVMIMASAPLIAPLIGSLTLALGSWRTIFWLLCGYGALSLAAAAVLQESHPPEKRIRDRTLFAQYGSYAALLKRGRFPWFLLCGTLIFGVLFAFVSASAFIYITQYGVNKTSFGYFFSFNMIAMLLGSLINGRKVAHYGYLLMLGFAVRNTFFWSLALLACAASGFGGLWGIVLPSFMMLLTVSMAGANAVAGLLELAPDSAGAASALFGVCQFCGGALISALIGWLGNNALALGVVAALAAFGAMLAWLGIRRQAAISTRETP